MKQVDKDKSLTRLKATYGALWEPINLPGH